MNNKLLVALAFVIGTQAVHANDDAVFLAMVCMARLEQNATLSSSQIEELCTCEATATEAQLTPEQLSVVQYLREVPVGEPADRYRGTSAQEGLKAAMRRSRDYCAKAVESGAYPITDNAHQRFRTLSRKSTEEVLALIDMRCKHFESASSQRTQCTADVSEAWLKTIPDEYEKIPPHYISGREVAREMIRLKDMCPNGGQACLAKHSE